MNPKILGLIQSILMIAGSVLVANGTITSGQEQTIGAGLQQISGGAIAVGGLLWNLYQDHQHAKALAAASAAPGISQPVTVQAAGKVS